MKKYSLTYHQFSSNSILISWPNSIDNFIFSDLSSYKLILENSIKSIIEVRAAYCSLLVVYDHEMDDFYRYIIELKSFYSLKKTDSSISNYKWKIPVCYDQCFGSDLEILSKTKSMSIDEIIDLHSLKSYKVYFMGFLPGFLYLGGLDKKLHIPRKDNPKLNILKGSVAIGGQQTGVYPSNSPGGWYVIGNSPINFFDINKSKICFAKPGDELSFYTITKEEHENISKNLSSFKLESEVIYG